MSSSMALQFSSPSFSNLLTKKRTPKGKHNDDDTNFRNKKACKLKINVDDMILQISKGDPTKLLLAKFIKQQLAAIDRTPDHPVYAMMIRDAITNLNEEGGSTREAISEFILRKYDVIEVVHPAKLIDQLRKLASQQEIILTSENRYMVPVENASDDDYLKLPENGERDEQGYKQCNSEEVVHLLGGLNEKNGNNCQTAVEEMNIGIMESQLEGQDVRVCQPCIVGGRLLEDENTISEEKCQLQFPAETLNGCPLAQGADSISKQTPEITEMFHVDERSTKIFERCEHNELSEPPGFQVNASEREMLTLEGQIVIMNGGHIVEVNEGDVKVIDEVVLCEQHIHQVNDENDVEEVQHSKEETETTSLSQEKGQSDKEVEVQNIGSLQALLRSKDKFTVWRKGMVTMERELMEMIDRLSSVDVPECIIALDKPEEFLGTQSDPKDKVQHMWNRQIGDNITKRKELNSQLKSFVTSAESLFKSLEQLTMMKRQHLCSSGCSLEVCGTQNLSACELVGSSSSPGPVGCQKLDLEQQLEPEMMESCDKMGLSQSQQQDLDSYCQQNHVECNEAAMTSEAVQILENSPNVNPEAVNNLAGTPKKKRKWKDQLPTRTGLRQRSHGGFQPDQTMPETLQLSGRNDKPQPNASELQIKRRGRPPLDKTSTRMRKFHQ